MPVPKRSLFRSNAVKHYMQVREKHESPRFTSLRTTIFLWTLLVLLLAAGALVWSEQVPAYVTNPGIVVANSATHLSRGKPEPATAMAVFFFSPAQAEKLHRGVSVRLHVGSSGPQFISQIAHIEPEAMSPVALRSRFHLEKYSLLVNQPSTVVMVELDPAFATAYAGSTVTADIQVGSQSLISLLPGVGSLLGE